MTTQFIEYSKQVARNLGLVGILKPIYNKLGLPEYFSRKEERAFLHKYREQKVFEVNLPGLDTILFETEEVHSKRFFYPKYIGNKIHEESGTHLLLETLKDKENFTDIGANLGWFTCIAAKALPQGKVIGFEMDEYNVGLARRNVEINGCNNVELHQLAVSDNLEPISYNRGRAKILNFRISSKGEAVQEKSVQVAAITMDGFYKEQGIVPDVIKIDVEGAEMMVLKGMQRTLTEENPTMFLEIHPPQLLMFGSSAEEVLTYLFDRNYLVSEIRETRGHNSEKRLKVVNRDTILTNNTMVIAHK